LMSATCWLISKRSAALQPPNVDARLLWDKALDAVEAWKDLLADEDWISTTPPPVPLQLPASGTQSLWSSQSAACFIVPLADAPTAGLDTRSDHYRACFERKNQTLGKLLSYLLLPLHYSTPFLRVTHEWVTQGLARASRRSARDSARRLASWRRWISRWRSLMSFGRFMRAVSVSRSLACTLR
jgi:hypothetical protein